jgi:hypothetical protein
MAKRSIEIIISAENRTETALAAAKASVARYADDVKRIQQNIRVGGEGFGAGLERAQGQLTSARGRAFDLQTIAERSAAEPVAYAENARFDKERYEGIRASVGATDELAGSHRKVSAEIARSNEGMDTSVQRAISIGKAMMIAHVATKGIEFAASMLEGDFDKAAEAFKRIPIVGEGATAGFHLGTALAGAVLGDGGFDQGDGGIGDRLNARGRLEKIAADAQGAANRVGMREDVRLLTERKEAREAELAVIDELEKTGAMGGFEARAAVNAKYAAMDAEDRRKAAALDAEADQKRKEQQAEAEAERTREAANADYNNMLAAAAANGEREERAAAATREAANAEYNNMLAAAEERAVEPMFRDLRAPGGGVAAQEAGFLTGVGRYSQEATAAKNAETTAKATEKTAKAVEKLAADLAPFASGEFLEWLRKTGRAPVANF